MSRAGYSEDFDNNWQLIIWRGAVASAIKGRRGQQFFRDLIAALDALPEKKLIAESLQAADGCVCALGALGKARGLDMTGIDPEDSQYVASEFGIADALAREVVYTNDEGGLGVWDATRGRRLPETDEARFARVREWAVSQIIPADKAPT